MKVGELGLIDLERSIDGKYYTNTGGTRRRVTVAPAPADGAPAAGEEPSE